MKYDNYNYVAISLGATCLPSCVIAVLLRFYARKAKNIKYGWDDWWAAIGLLVFSVFMGILIYGGHHGAGYSYMELPYPVLQDFLKMSWIGSLFNPAVFVAAKTSILCFYNRIFNINPRFSIAVKIVMVLNVLWGVGTTLALVFQCQPLRRAWSPLVAGKCINPYLFMILTETPNSVLDIVIMVLPIGIIRKLHLRFIHKVSLGIVFMLGGAVAIVGFVRIAILYREPELVYNLSAGIAITSQQTCAIICCCLPTFRQLFRKADWISSLTTSIQSPFRSLLTRYRGDSIQSSKGPRSAGFDQLSNSKPNEGWGVPLSKTLITHEDSLETTAYPMDFIAVKRTADIV
ncbi:hypothetical protein B0O99DRAFT_633838 [Bisporella sp. PMI_857]|nr:hypothetical protein B0O99DRAFT_633838 [Bisporella sp. PMI_857]